MTEEVVEEETEREVPAEFANHGECVADAAHDWESEGSTEAMTHGAWVSENARYTCWGLDVPTEEATEEVTEETSVEEVADATELTAKEERKAEQTAARAERKTDRTAAQAAKPSPAKANAASNGRGGGRP